MEYIRPFIEGVLLLFLLWKTTNLEKAFLQFVKLRKTEKQLLELNTVFLPADTVLKHNDRFLDPVINWYIGQVLRIHKGQQVFEDFIVTLEDLRDIRHPGNYSSPVVRGMTNSLEKAKVRILEKFICDHWPGNDRFLTELSDLKYVTYYYESEQTGAGS